MKIAFAFCASFMGAAIVHSLTKNITAAWGTSALIAFVLWFFEELFKELAEKLKNN